jgi:hypothetical protein
MSQTDTQCCSSCGHTWTAVEQEEDRKISASNTLVNGIRRGSALIKPDAYWSAQQSSAAKKAAQIAGSRYAKALEAAGPLPEPNPYAHLK